MMLAVVDRWTWTSCLQRCLCLCCRSPKAICQQRMPTCAITTMLSSLATSTRNPSSNYQSDLGDRSSSFRTDFRMTPFILTEITALPPPSGDSHLGTSGRVLRGLETRPWTLKPAAALQCLHFTATLRLPSPVYRLVHYTTTAIITR